MYRRIVFCALLLFASNLKAQVATGTIVGVIEDATGAVVPNAHDKAPVDPSWSTPDPVRGLDPGQSASFAFAPTKQGSYRIASLVGGNEASGMWLDLEVVASGRPTLSAPGT